jgi:hypothetical protein
MGTMQSLKHVATAVRHAEVLADEAEDLGLTDLAQRLSARGSSLALDVEDAVAAFDLVKPMREHRLRAHALLDVAFTDATVRLSPTMGPDELSRLTPGGYLDVVERTRYRLRHLEARGDDRVAGVIRDLKGALDHYDRTVDAYLVACADCQGKKDRAVVRSQALRLELDGAKARLLLMADVGSDAWNRIKRRTVRTKRARWIDDAKARQLLTDVYENITQPEDRPG